MLHHQAHARRACSTYQAAASSGIFAASSRRGMARIGISIARCIRHGARRHRHRGIARRAASNASSRRISIVTRGAHQSARRHRASGVSFARYRHHKARHRRITARTHRVKHRVGSARHRAAHARNIIERASARGGASGCARRARVSSHLALCDARHGGGAASRRHVLESRHRQNCKHAHLSRARIARHRHGIARVRGTARSDALASSASATSAARHRWRGIASARRASCGASAARAHQGIIGAAAASGGASAHQARRRRGMAQGIFLRRVHAHHRRIVARIIASRIGASYRRASSARIAAASCGAHQASSK